MAINNGDAGDRGAITADLITPKTYAADGTADATTGLATAYNNADVLTTTKADADVVLANAYRTLFLTNGAHTVNNGRLAAANPRRPSDNNALQAEIAA